MIITGKNQYGCDTTIQKPVKVLEAPEPTVKGPDLVCSKATTAHELMGDRIKSVNWQVENGDLNTTESGNESAEIQWKPSNATDSMVQSGYIHAKVVGVKGCKAEDRKHVKIHSIKAGLTPSQVTGCAPRNTVFSASESRNATAYDWQFHESASGSGQTAIHHFDEPGNHEVRLIATNQVNCADTAFAQVNLSQQPLADFTFRQPDTPSDYTLNQDRLAIENRSEKAQRYEWDFGDGHGSTQANPQHLYQELGEFQVMLVAKSGNGCVDTISKPVDVNATPHLYIPTAFTPGADGLNDQFSVETINIKEFKIRIYNRWGETIFVSKDQDFQWDGTYKGEPVPLETYLFVATARGLEGEFIKKTGKLTVIK